MSPNDYARDQVLKDNDPPGFEKRKVDPKGRPIKIVIYILLKVNYCYTYV